MPIKVAKFGPVGQHNWAGIFPQLRTRESREAVQVTDPKGGPHNPKWKDVEASFSTVYEAHEVDSTVQELQGALSAEDAKLRKDIADSLSAIATSLSGLTVKLAANEAFIAAITSKLLAKEAFIDAIATIVTERLEDTGTTSDGPET